MGVTTKSSPLKFNILWRICHMRHIILNILWCICHMRHRILSQDFKKNTRIQQKYTEYTGNIPAYSNISQKCTKLTGIPRNSLKFIQSDKIHQYRESKCYTQVMGDY